MEHLGADVPFEVESHQGDLDNGKSEAWLVMGIRDHLVLTALGLVRVYARVSELVLVLLRLFWVWITRDRTWKR